MFFYLFGTLLGDLISKRSVGNDFRSVQAAEQTTDDESEPLLASRDVVSGDAVVVQRRSRATAGGSRDNLPPSISSYYNITEIIEMGKMASLFFNRFGKKKIRFSRTFFLYAQSTLELTSGWIEGVNCLTLKALLYPAWLFVPN